MAIEIPAGFIQVNVKELADGQFDVKTAYTWLYQWKPFLNGIGAGTLVIKPDPNVRWGPVDVYEPILPEMANEDDHVWCFVENEHVQACHIWVAISTLNDFGKVERLKWPTRRKIKKVVGAVLVYDLSASSGIHGQTVGADGSGSFAIAFLGDAEKCSIAAYRNQEEIQAFFKHRVRYVNIVTAEECYAGVPLSEITVN
jgi:hypothetical protein